MGMNEIATKKIEDKLFVSVATTTLTEQKEMQLKMESSTDTNPPWCVEKGPLPPSKTNPSAAGGVGGVMKESGGWKVVENK